MSNYTLSPEKVELLRVQENLRQETEAFEQEKRHIESWFVLKLAMGISSIVLMFSILMFSGFIILNNNKFTNNIVTWAGIAMFVDTLGVVVSIWKVIFNQGSISKLQPITQVNLKDVSSKTVVANTTNNTAN